jgi:Domain of unknown function (DUF4188)
VKRSSAELDGDFVVFLIGMQIRKPWAVHKWLPVFMAMRRMLRELTPAAGLLSFERAFIGGPAVVQYWRSQEQLDAFAHAAMHKAAWRDWNRRIRDSRAVGIWHETYQVRAGTHESAYQQVYGFGLAGAGAGELQLPQ